MQVNPITQFTHYFVVDTTGGVLQGSRSVITITGTAGR